MARNLLTQELSRSGQRDTACLQLGVCKPKNGPLECHIYVYNVHKYMYRCPRAESNCSTIFKKNGDKFFVGSSRTD